jgi:hypothetical protein
VTTELPELQDVLEEWKAVLTRDDEIVCPLSIHDVAIWQSAMARMDRPATGKFSPLDTTTPWMPGDPLWTVVAHAQEYKKSMADLKRQLTARRTEPEEPGAKEKHGEMENEEEDAEDGEDATMDDDDEAIDLCDKQ